MFLVKLRAPGLATVVLCSLINCPLFWRVFDTKIFEHGKKKTSRHSKKTLPTNIQKNKNWGSPTSKKRARLTNLQFLIVLKWYRSSIQPQIATMKFSTAIRNMALAATTAVIMFEEASAQVRGSRSDGVHSIGQSAGRILKMGGNGGGGGGKLRPKLTFSYFQPVYSRNRSSVIDLLYCA